MPRFLACAALLLSLICVTSSQAQQATQPTATKASLFTGNASGFNGVDPRNITFTPVNTTAAMRSFNSTNIMPTGVGMQKPSSLTNFFRSFSLPSWPPKLATTSVLPQKQNQFQPTLPKGQYPFPPAASQK